MNLHGVFFRNTGSGKPLSGTRHKPPYSPRPPPTTSQAAAIAGTMQQLIDDLPEEVALLDEDCTIVAVNQAWRQTCEEHGFPDNAPGRNYRDFCAARAAEGYEPAVQAVAALNDITSGKRTSWQLLYNSKNLWDGHDYRICFHRIAVGGQPLISVTRYDLTELVELRRLRDDFTNARIGLANSLDSMIEGFTEQVAIVDEEWRIVAVNDAWREMARDSDYPGLAQGMNYGDFLRTFVLKGQESALATLRGIEAIDRGETSSFELTYPGADRWEGRTLQLHIHRLRIEGRTFATISRHDITDTAELHRLKDDFAHSLIEGQSTERQRMARDLHDSTSQLLASIGLLLGNLKQTPGTPEATSLVDEMQGLVRETQQEIRAISYIAHPPSLSQMGLAAATKALVEGFGRRTGLDASFEIAGKLLPMSPVIESTLYRVAQEALTNIHRHAHARSIEVLLCVRGLITHLIFADDGCGISDETLAGRGSAGVGLSGMRSRLAEIGGRLTVQRLPLGTAIIASIPAHG